MKFFIFAPKYPQMKKLLLSFCFLMLSVCVVAQSDASYMLSFDTLRLADLRALPGDSVMLNGISVAKNKIDVALNYDLGAESLAATYLRLLHRSDDAQPYSRTNFTYLDVERDEYTEAVTHWKQQETNPYRWPNETDEHFWNRYFLRLYGPGPAKCEGATFEIYFCPEKVFLLPKPSPYVVYGLHRDEKQEVTLAGGFRLTASFGNVLVLRAFTDYPTEVIVINDNNVAVYKVMQ